MMTTERPGEADRAAKWARLLDTLAAVAPRNRRAAIRTLNLKLTARQERLLLTFVEVWSQAEYAEYRPTINPAEVERRGAYWFWPKKSETSTGVTEEPEASSAWPRKVDDNGGDDAA
jgi:hypothetical protein